MQIPIEFDYEGIQFSGTLQDVCGGGAQVFHFYDSLSYYLGRLRKAGDKWVFDSTPKLDLSEIADYLGGVVEEKTVKI